MTERGNRSETVLPLVYRELRALAQGMMAQVPPGNTLQATALVHEAYLRLKSHESVRWNGKGHFFGAAAIAMRQILVDQARRKAARKHGGGQQRVVADETELRIDLPSDDVLAVDEALTRLEEKDPRAARVVNLRYFAGLTMRQVSEVLDISLSTVEREWRFARAFLASHVREGTS